MAKRTGEVEMKIFNTDKADIYEFINCCQANGHIQQVAFSTYHNALTQICFTCNEIRTTMKKEDYEEQPLKEQGKN